jgi:hypothetical protein
MGILKKPNLRKFSYVSGYTAGILVSKVVTSCSKLIQEILKLLIKTAIDLSYLFPYHNKWYGIKLIKK